MTPFKQEEVDWTATAEHLWSPQFPPQCHRCRSITSENLDIPSLYWLLCAFAKDLSYVTIPVSAGTVCVGYLQASYLYTPCSVLQQNPLRQLWKEGLDSPHSPPRMMAQLSAGIALCSGAAWRLVSGHTEIPTWRPPVPIVEICFCECVQSIASFQISSLPHLCRWLTGEFLDHLGT